MTVQRHVIRSLLSRSEKWDGRLCITWLGCSSYEKDGKMTKWTIGKKGFICGVWRFPLNERTFSKDCGIIMNHTNQQLSIGPLDQLKIKQMLFHTFLLCSYYFCISFHSGKSCCGLCKLSVSIRRFSMTSKWRRKTDQQVNRYGLENVLKAKEAIKILQYIIN